MKGHRHENDVEKLTQAKKFITWSAEMQEAYARKLDETLSSLSMPKNIYLMILARLYLSGRMHRTQTKNNIYVRRR